MSLMWKQKKNSAQMLVNFRLIIQTSFIDHLTAISGNPTAVPYSHTHHTRLDVSPSCVFVSHSVSNDDVSVGRRVKGLPAQTYV